MVDIVTGTSNNNQKFRCGLSSVIERLTPDVSVILELAYYNSSNVKYAVYDKYTIF